jgi:HPt (histidine-containing phosphotransfer) domain-containing protein
VPMAAQPMALDRNALMELVGGDSDLAAHVLAKFAAAAEGMVERIADAAKRRDGKATVNAAHGLKGSARTACAPRMAECAAAIEAAATEEKWACIDRRTEELKRELATTQAAIQGAPAIAA